MKKWLCILAALVMLTAAFTVQAEEQKIEYTGGVVMRILPRRGNEAPGAEHINVGYVECNLPYLLLGQTTHWELGIEGGTAPYEIEVSLWRQDFDVADSWYMKYDGFDLDNPRFFNYVFQEEGRYFWQITVKDSSGETLVFQTRPLETAKASDESNANTVAGKVNQIVAQLIKPNMNDYQRALVLHDWLIYNANYDYGKTWYEPAGVLLHGTGVCDSYARAYLMLCTAAGLECLFVTGNAGGGSHGWNLVKVDGAWYHVDCTWDDPGRGGQERHTYFLLTDEQMALDHNWNLLENEEMIVPEAKDESFEGSSAMDYDFTFASMKEFETNFMAMVNAGERRANIVGKYTGSLNTNQVWGEFMQWAQGASNLLNRQGWCSGASAAETYFTLSLSWREPVQYIRINEEKLNLAVGEQLDIVPADYYPLSNAFTWESSNPAVAKVSASYNTKDGLKASVKGISAGKAVITVTSKDGHADSFEVTVMAEYTPMLGLEAETGEKDIHLTWHSIPGVTEYHVMRAYQGKEDCIAIVTEHEATLTREQLPSNVKQEVWVIGLRIVGGKVAAEYCGEHLVFGEDSGPVEHTPVVDAAVAPTCTETGLTEGSHCERCGGVIVAQKVVPALGHSLVDDGAVEATCTEPGLSAGKHCERCDKVVKEQKEIPALGHNKKIVEGVPATHVTTGMTDGVVCSRCNETLSAQVELPMVKVNRFVLPDFVTAIETEAFMGCKFECVVIGAGCRSIGAYAFANNTALRFVEIPGAVQQIDATAFEGCKAIIVTTAGSAAEAFAQAQGMICVIR